MYLRQNGFEVMDAWSLSGGMRAIELIDLDIAIIDLELGDGDGLALVRALHAKQIPCMVVSVRNSAVDRILSLELGADDYMTKPIDLREMLLRANRIIAYNASLSRKASPLIDVGTFQLDLVNRSVILADGKQNFLSRSESMLLKCFLENQGKIVDRTTLLRRLYKWENSHGRALDMLVSKLRSKIDRPGQPTAIRSVRGFGYVFDTGPQTIAPEMLAKISTIDDEPM